MHIRNAVLIVFFVLSGWGVSLAGNGGPDIRYRSIIYFYPDVGNIVADDLLAEFKEYKKVDALPKKANEAVVHYSFLKEFEQTYPVPDKDYLAYFGRGLNKEQVASIQKSALALVVDVAYPMKWSHQGIQSTSRSLYAIAKSYGGLIWDSETRELFAPDAWKARRIESWDGPVPIIQNHIVIHAYKDKGGVRAITLGMAKFGLPDIVVNNFSWSLNKPMGNLVNLVAQALAEGLSPTQENTLQVDVRRLADTQYKRGLVSTLKDNAKEQIDISFGEGEWEEGDPNNYIIELLFDNAKGDSLSEKQEHLLSALFGWEDSISYVKHNSLIEEASDRAKRQLDRLRDDFNAGLQPGEFIQVKAPFKIPDGGNEWMWVEVMSWRGDEITGLLKNSPYHVPGLRGGAEVIVSQKDVFDYIRIYPDGTSEGNETGALILKYQQ